METTHCNALLTSTTMTASFTIQLTDQQLYILQEIAEDHYRTMDNLLGLLIAEGLKFYGFSHEYCVKKRQEDRDSSGLEFQHYKDEEVEKIFATLPFLQPDNEHPSL
jgi:hypothetical protein